jgi:putative ABC transport system permease protein
MDIPVDIPIFLAQGLTLSACAIALVSVHQAVIGRTVARLTGRSLPVRLGLAYPLARRFRTAMTLGMFSIVMLTLVYLSIISHMFQGQADRLAGNLSGGFQIVATSNPTDPLTSQELSSLPGVKMVAPLSYVFADFTVGNAPPMGWPVTGIGPEFVKSPPKLAEIGEYSSNRAAWAAVQSDPGLIIVDRNFLLTPGQLTSDPTNIGDTIRIVNSQSGEVRELRIAAKAEGDLIGNGAFVSALTLQDLFGPRSVPSRFFVSSTDPRATVASLRSTFIAKGADASTILGLVDSTLAKSAGFFALMEQFVGAGLVVGVAGIGVIMVRAVRERRREVGVLRSLGFQSHSVAELMMFEAGFIAFEGIAIGVIIALVASYGFTTVGADWAVGFKWGVPVPQVTLMVALAIFSTLLTSFWPARRAAHIRPAAALRITD